MKTMASSQPHLVILVDLLDNNNDTGLLHAVKTESGTEQQIKICLLLIGVLGIGSVLNLATFALLLG